MTDAFTQQKQKANIARKISARGAKKGASKQAAV